MILNHNLKELQKKLKGHSIMERCQFVDKLNESDAPEKIMEDRLEYGNTQMLRRVKPKRFCPFYSITDKDLE